MASRSCPGSVKENMNPAVTKMKLDFVGAGNGTGRMVKAAPRQIELVQEGAFLKAIEGEKRRCERSGNAFILMLADLSPLTSRTKGDPDVIHALSHSTRDTDLVGWYRHGAVVGVIYTEVSGSNGAEVAELLHAKARRALSEHVADAGKVGLSIHVFPQDGIDSWAIGPVEPNARAQAEVLYEPHPFAQPVKRAMDIAGSILALMLFSPVMLLVAILVKATSRGPILYKQQRVGLSGRTFTFLKFRSMKAGNDPSIHQKFIEDFIATGGPAKESGDKPLFKIEDDPRVTSIGRFIRKTSLDEFPQFFNVLKGDMSLVGPRPPIPYEVNCYDTWHKRRYLTVKPGLTGLWQVHGRSRTTFDEMVRLDLLYARSWNIWMDVKILLQTPLAVIRGDGAR